MIKNPMKTLFLPAGLKKRKCLTGIYRGLEFELDLNYQAQIWAGLYERETYHVIKNTAACCQWFIDIGAGKGELVVYFLKRTSANKVIAVEPQLSENEIMLRNLKYNGLDSDRRLVIVDKCVGTASGENFLSLDSFAPMVQGRGFLKIDVDGAEMDVLESGRNFLKNLRPAVLLETHSADLERQCADFFERLGFTTRIIRNAWWRKLIPEHRPIPHNRWLAATT
jgi:hypothetical protein